MRRIGRQIDALFPPDSAAIFADDTVLDRDIGLPSIDGYDVEGVLGRGDMGVVFRAGHRRLSPVVALKMTIAGAYAGPHERERFQREAEAVARLRHPNIVQVHDFGDSA